MLARLRDEAGQMRELRSPLSGRVWKITTAEGTQLSRDGELLVMPSSPEVKDFRQAFLRRLLDQLRS